MDSPEERTINVYEPDALIGLHWPCFCPCSTYCLVSIQIVMCLEVVVLLASIGTLFGTRNICRMESHIAVILMGVLAFCFLLSSTNTAVFTFIWTSRQKNGQKLPKVGLPLPSICSDCECSDIVQSFRLISFPIHFFFQLLVVRCCTAVVVVITIVVFVVVAVSF